jgi:hypothetical protein
MSIEHKVIGNSKKFTLAIGKYAFTPCEYIPKDYLQWLLESMASEQDKEIILKYLVNQKNE